MRHPWKNLGWVVAAALVFSPAISASPANPTSAARATALEHVASSAERLGLVAGDVADVTVAKEFKSRNNGLTHLYIHQRVGGIDVVNAIYNVAVDRQGKVFYTASRFVPHLAEKTAGQAVLVDVEQAITAAADHLGISLSRRPELLSQTGGIARESNWSGGSLSMDPIPAKLKYVPLEDGARVRLAWELVIYPKGGQHWWQLFVDASTGAVVTKFDWVAQDTYDVFPIPFNDPSETTQTTLTNPADPAASPFGWHDTNGVAGAEFTDTRGNNVSAQDDLDANNTGGTRPSGGGSLNFNVAFSSAQDPPAGTNLNAAIINLFYANNIVHDFAWHYGFDEASGNFQENNYGNGGLQGDPVQADAQDGSGVNNANFGTPPDGNDPRMQMFVWLAPPDFTVNTPPAVAGTYAVAGAGFGSQVTQAGFTNDLVLVNDGMGASVNDACETPFVNAAAVLGKIAILDRGNCEFGVKVLNAQTNGAIAAVVVNNVPDPIFSMGPGAVGAGVTIPSVMISQADGTAIKNNLPANVTMFRSLANRDSDNDMGVLAHEYGHGISNRLTGNSVGCLQNQEQMGEGWSDFFGLVLTAKATDTATMLRPIADYLAFNTGGIRPFPYTRDMTVNTHTYANVATAAVPHGVGSVWAEMLWEMYWNLVDRYGFSTDIYTGTAGNNLAIQLVMDGLKLQPCSPGFVDGRDAILAADLANNCGKNKCSIWEAFAKRGLGVSATQGSSASVTDGTQAFDLPPECATDWIFSDNFESGQTCAWSQVVD